MKSHSWLLILAMLVIAAPMAMAASDVIELTAKNFDEVVFKSKVPVLLEFYAPWCGHCKNLVPTYEEVATHLKGIAVVAKIDATVEEGLAHRYGIRGFPTLKLFKPGSKAKDLQDYQGARSSAALVSFVTGALSSNSILRLKASNSETLWSQKPTDVPRVLLFSSKPEPSTLSKSLSMRFENQLVFAQVRQHDPLCETYSVDTFPTLLVIPSQDSEPIKFDGKLGPEALVNFLSPLVQATTDSQSASSSSSTSGSESSTKPQSSRPTTPLSTWKSADDWDSLLEGCGKHWCVVLINHESDSLSNLKDRMLSHYGKDNKFQFVESSDASVSEKFSIASTDSQWVVFNAKKSKFATSHFDGSLPTALMDRIISGDAKLSKLQ